MCTAERRAPCGGHFTAGYLQTDISPPPGKKLYDVHLLGVCWGRAAGHFYLYTSELRKSTGKANAAAVGCLALKHSLALRSLSPIKGVPPILHSLIRVTQDGEHGDFAPHFSLLVPSQPSA